ncbi:hypothetical protein NicSoilC5_43300 [Arthrobacter sp. NicSoilC5]|nr:hypothetical protein NicSoilC5_00270 [Arthrobacter sp. NicSoilC5]BCW82311.1 hypothetical protein NicSoilC5_43300 [Arthrobacter sp. NicSoilC5]
MQPRVGSAAIPTHAYQAQPARSRYSSARISNAHAPVHSHPAYSGLFTSQPGNRTVLRPGGRTPGAGVDCSPPSVFMGLTVATGTGARHRTAVRGRRHVKLEQ